MKNRSSIITPPPDLSVVDGALAASENEAFSEDRKEMLKKLVRKGAPSVSNEDTKSQRDTVRMSIRLPVPLRERIYRATGENLTHMPLNTWIIEAIVAQLKKEGF